MVSVKGKLFEFFVCKLLLICGFRQVLLDDLIIFDGKPGTMIQGLGQAHNADVLLEPPFQTPFYFPTRLLVECKCYSDTIGLSTIRNALGLREDINNFDIVTEDILKNRRMSYTTKQTYYPLKRYSYQVAVASFSGFKSTAIPFAQTHRIPLISFSDSLLFKEIKDAILEVERKANEDDEYAKSVLQYLQNHQYEKYINDNIGLTDESFDSFLKAIDWFQEKIVIGLLEDGTIIFLVRDETHNLKHDPYSVKRYDDGCEIYWRTDKKAWELWDGEQCYLFELPKEIYLKWIESAEKQAEVAIRIKQEYFSRIVLFESDLKDRDSIRTLYLSEKFIKTAKESIM